MHSQQRLFSEYLSAMSNYSAPYVKDHHWAVVIVVGYALVIITLGLCRSSSLCSMLRRKQKPGIDGYTFLFATVGNPRSSVSKFETLKNSNSVVVHNPSLIDCDKSMV